MTEKMLGSHVSPLPSSERVRLLSEMRSLSDENPGYLVKLAYHSMNRMLDQEVTPQGMTAMQWRPLIMLALKRADTSAELARLNDVDTGAMTRTLDRLEAKGLIERRRSLEDRRVVHLELTDAGQATATKICPSIARVLNQHFRGFSPEEIETLSHFLKRMIANGSAPITPAQKS
jgi:DNA-binding MarR family transcriptional regulator